MTTTRIDAIAALTADDDTLSDHLRDFLFDSIDDDTIELTHPLGFALNAMLDALDADERDALRLAYSVCPMHHCDYAICFDDDDDECAAIRIAHPDHDT